MGHYIANLRDIEFCLFDLLDRESILGKGIYSDLDKATAMGMLEEVKRLCEVDLAESFIEGDRKGTDFDKTTGEVKVPASFKKSYRAYVDGGWGLIDVPTELGGTQIPPSIRWAIAEMVLGSNMFDFETGALGKRNGVYVTNVEHKMGLNVSSTCEMNLGEKEPAVGYLLGEVHDGIAQMFKIIEFARMMVGTKAISTLSAGYQQALAYAKTRVQGGDMKDMANKASPRVTVIHHPDVRRSLMTQKAYAEGMRALVLYTATIQDEVLLARANGKSEDEIKDLEHLNDLLLPIVKGYGSERAWTLLGTESLQTFGGSGFTQDWPLEQYVRDAKIDTLYEGTTAIQGLDFFFRKIIKDNGRALTKLSKEIGKVAASGGNNAEEKASLGKALEEMQAIIGLLVTHALASQEKPDEIYKCGLNTSRLLMAVGDVIISWLLLRQADIAASKIGSASGKEKDFFEGKIAASRYFIHNFLPLISATRAIVEREDGEIMTISEGA
ncbi:MAG: acyl-CoA dehydrogenase, partial [Actinobacteria bacterium]|nr:acyl-CoA dehydrogenase [Actinomycetota bacterium]